MMTGIGLTVNYQHLPSNHTILGGLSGSPKYLYESKIVTQPYLVRNHTTRGLDHEDISL